MYCEYYDFKEKPFTVTPNPRFIFLSKSHREAFAHLLYGIDSHAGFIELTGEIGTGKTTVLRTLLSQLDEKVYRTALILNPCLSATELLRCINREYGIAAEGLSNADLLQELNRFLLNEKAAGRTVVLVIDEAQHLEPSVLEQIRLISNLETDTDKLIQIVLAGQPELGRLLKRSDLRQISQRITVRYHLGPMDLADTAAYVRHRLSVAGCGLTVHFTPLAMKRIFRYSRGTPRLINILCDRSLLVGYGEGRRQISPQLVKSAIREISRRGNNGFHRFYVKALGLCLVVVLLVFFFYLMQKGPERLPVSLAKGVAGKIASADSVATGVPDDVKKRLAELGEKESFLASFNALARVWGVRPINAYRGAKPQLDLIQLAESRDLNVFVLQGDMDSVSRTDSPAILELDVPGLSEKRYLALTGIKAGRLFVVPTLAGHPSFTPEELKLFWSGRAYVLWKNFGKIPRIPSSAASALEIIRLQKMLANSGFNDVSQNGVYDAGTAKAVKAYQRSRGLEVDGVVGGKTLLFLYREAGEFSSPRLNLDKGENRG
jgi:general secretion pathway protein A